MQEDCSEDYVYSALLAAAFTNSPLLTFIISICVCVLGVGEASYSYNNNFQVDLSNACLHTLSQLSPQVGNSSIIAGSVPGDQHHCGDLLLFQGSGADV